MFKRVRRAFSPQKETNFSGGIAPNKNAVPTSLPAPPQATAATVIATPAAAAATTTDQQTTDEAAQAAAGRNPADTQAAQTGIKPSTVVVQNQLTTTTGASSSAVVMDEFQSFWHRELDYQLEEMVLDETNYWTPNSISLFTALTIIGNFISTNSHAAKYFPNYCHPATLIYYSVLFYVQILRARKAAEKLTGVERKFLRRFEGKFPFETLPVAGPIFPILSTLIATQIGDGKYDWNVPQIAPGMFATGRTLAGLDLTNGNVYLQPQIPYMIGILRTQISDNFRERAIANEAHYFTDDDQLTVNIPDAGRHPLHFGMDLHRGTQTNQDHVLLPSLNGVDNLPFIGMDNLVRSGPTWNRSKFNQVHIGATSIVAANPTRFDQRITNTDGTYVINTLAAFMYMPEEENMEWFEFPIEQAITQAKFATKTYNMSQVPTVGGNETLILAQFKRHGTQTNATADFANARLGVTHNNFNWFPSHFERMTAAFKTDRANYKRSEELQALSFAPNATLPIPIGNIRVGEHETQRRGSYYHPDTKERTRAELRTDIGQHVGKPMYSRWNDLFLEKFLVIKPDLN